MSDHVMRVVSALLFGALCAPSATVSAQTPRDALGARIDSLLVAYEMQRERVRVLDSLRHARDVEQRTDTTIVGPFVIIDTVSVARLAESLSEAWSAYAAVAGRSVAGINGVVVTKTLRFPPGRRAYRLDAFMWGNVDVTQAAHGIVRAALTDALPAELRAWLDGEGLVVDARHEWTYRELAMSQSRAARDCFAGDTHGCVIALGLIDGMTPSLSRRARASLLAHILETGGAGAYERLSIDAPDIAARLAHGAGRSIDEVVANWRQQIIAARPNVLAGVARAGFWTVVWLAVLAGLAMRSTRWRIG